MLFVQVVDLVEVQMVRVLIVQKMEVVEGRKMVNGGLLR